MVENNKSPEAEEPRPRRLLVVEDDEGLNNLAQKALCEAGYDTEGVLNGAEAIERVMADPEVVLLLDIKLPDMTGSEIINTLIERNCPVPFIVMTGHGDERTAVEMMKLGASDYLVKELDLVERLPGAFRRLFRERENEQRLLAAEEELRASEKKYRNLVDSSTVCVAHTTAGGEILYANEATLKIFGYDSLDEVKTVGAVTRYKHPDDRQRFIKRLKKSGKVDNFEVTLLTKTGEEKEFLLSASLDEEMISVALLDITERKRAEKAIHRHNQELTTLLEVSKTLASTLNMETVLQATTDSIARYLELETSAVYLLEGDKLYLGATMPPLPPAMPDSFRIAPLSDHPHIEETISKKQTKFLLDTKSASLSSPEKAIVEARNIRSLLYIPLIAEEKVIGVLLVGSTGIPRDITDSEIESCSTLANIASLAIANTQLYKASQSNAADLEREVTERKQAEQALRASEENFRSIFHSAPESLLTVDKEIDVLNSNKKFGKLIHLYAPRLNMSEDALRTKILSELKMRVGKVKHGLIEIDNETNN